MHLPIGWSTFCLNCPSRGKKVPDESVFCLHCGARLSNAVLSQMVTARDTPPIAIENLFLELCGPTDVKKKGTIFTKTDLGRGFKFGFSLTDSNNRPTVSDGQLFAALMYYCSFIGHEEGDGSG